MPPPPPFSSTHPTIPFICLLICYVVYFPSICNGEQFGFMYEFNFLCFCLFVCLWKINVIIIIIIIRFGNFPRRLIYALASTFLYDWLSLVVYWQGKMVVYWSEWFGIAWYGFRPRPLGIWIISLFLTRNQHDFTAQSLPARPLVSNKESSCLLPVSHGTLLLKGQ
jgi:hypothetical protein